MSEGEEKFEKRELGLSDSYPLAFGSIKKVRFMVFQEWSFKVVGYNIAKTGKHGYTKASITGIFFFTGKNMTIQFLPLIILKFQILKDLHILQYMLILMYI